MTMVKPGTSWRGTYMHPLDSASFLIPQLIYWFQLTHDTYIDCRIVQAYVYLRHSKHYMIRTYRIVSISSIILHRILSFLERLVAMPIKCCKEITSIGIQYEGWYICKSKS
ncbi:hypothetical protein KC19_5G090200 [Ceratodon purpureus]|uniref:Uncharacterized protein n=1 Tax=Ceratodon purpureus TaxID=3225 RepID=A0A8T0HZG6_CERPU|nr:hypothetical protein KC19_5G090200 [Ceratodon purpureus]